ncbi:MAG TPA: GNAT family N-acetyltransferase [Acidimicrobiia bacterium]|nr:GNAT family N-acetyltransferase [Acidimicrobiia bacterium]
MVLAVPDLADDRLRLRPPALTDVDAITLAVQDPAIARFTRIPAPYGRADAVAWVGAATSAWRRGDEAGFVIVERDSDTLLGGIGVHQLRGTDGHPFVGYWVAAPARGQGVATGALRLVVGWAFGTLGLERLTAWVYTDNPVSPRVLEAVGFRRDVGEPAPLAHATGPRPAHHFTLTRVDA